MIRLYVLELNIDHSTATFFLLWGFFCYLYICLFYMWYLHLKNIANFEL